MLVHRQFSLVAFWEHARISTQHYHWLTTGGWHFISLHWLIVLSDSNNDQNLENELITFKVIKKVFTGGDTRDIFPQLQYKQKPFITTKRAPPAGRYKECKFYGIGFTFLTCKLHSFYIPSIINHYNFSERKPRFLYTLHGLFNVLLTNNYCNSLQSFLLCGGRLILYCACDRCC